MNLVDSSGWLEYLVDGHNAPEFSEPINDTSQLIVPTISLYEVFKVMARARDETDAFVAMSLMDQAKVIPLNAEIAVRAAMESASCRLAMADSIILATALVHEATLWTQDVDFAGIEGVNYFPAGQD